MKVFLSFSLLSVSFCNLFSYITLKAYTFIMSIGNSGLWLQCMNTFVKNKKESSL